MHAGIASADAANSSTLHWERLISSTYYPQEAQPAGDRDFLGRLTVLELGALSLSRIQSTPVTYRRHADHIRRQDETFHLVTIPLAGDLFFNQGGRHSHCPPNCFLTEQGDMPYELYQPGANELLVLRVPESVLDGHMPRGASFPGHTIGQPAGLSGLFIDYARSVMSGMHELEPAQFSLIGRHLIELLVGGLKQSQQITESTSSSVKEAHLRRIKAAVRQRLQEPTLSAIDIADACGLSVRYVHRLFSATGTSMRRWITEQRLLECDGLLRNPRTHMSLAMIAQQYGFCDQSHFNKLYKRRFGRTPGETREEARRTASLA